MGSSEYDSSWAEFGDYRTARAEWDNAENFVRFFTRALGMQNDVNHNCPFRNHARDGNRRLI